jgi:hypothetical protein
MQLARLLHALGGTSSILAFSGLSTKLSINHDPRFAGLPTNDELGAPFPSQDTRGSHLSHLRGRQGRGADECGVVLQAKGCSFAPILSL